MEFSRTGKLRVKTAMTPLFLLFVSNLLVPALPEEILLPPQPENVIISGSQLTWTPAAENAMYTVEYRREGARKWQNVSECVRIPSSSCDVSTIRNAERCVRVRVRAERGGRTSEAVEACSHHGEPCSPEFSLSPGPGSMTVSLTKSSVFNTRHADNGNHLIYFGREGERLQKYEEAASKTFSSLEEGRRYCARVQYGYFSEPAGPPRCLQCETTLVTETVGTTIITCLVVFIVLIILITFLFYILIFKFKKIKEWMKPPYDIPNLFPERHPEQRVFLPSTSEERYDVITSMTAADGLR